LYVAGCVGEGGASGASHEGEEEGEEGEEEEEQARRRLWVGPSGTGLSYWNASSNVPMLNCCPVKHVTACVDISSYR